MMYIIGTTRKDYIINGILLPASEYSEEERALGRTEITEIDEMEYAKLSVNKIFQSLVQQGVVKVLDRRPVGRESPDELRASASNANEEVRALKAELEQIKDEALREIDKKEKELQMALSHTQEQAKEIVELKARLADQS